jgi:hypothetical protein
MHVDILQRCEEDPEHTSGIPFYYNICKTTGEVLPVGRRNGQPRNHISDIDFRGIYISDDRRAEIFWKKSRQRSLVVLPIIRLQKKVCWRRRSMARTTARGELDSTKAQKAGEM